jgi:2-oxoglutarate ferredoxin oxidoreductase subunit alpha
MGDEVYELVAKAESRGNGHANGQVNGHVNGQANDRAPGLARAAVPLGEDDSGYLRYRITEDGISPMSIPGTEGGQYVAMGLEHNEKSRHRPDPRTHTYMTDKRFRKIEGSQQDAPEPVRYGNPDAEIGIVTWGSTAGVAIEAIDELAKEGIEACLLAPRMLLPVPDHQVGEFMRSKKHVVVPEVNYRGQYADVLQAKYPRPVLRVNVYGGRPMLVGRLVDVLRQVSRGEVTEGRIALNPIYGKLEELVTPDDLLAPVENR